MFMVYKPALTLWINKPFGKFLLGWQTKGKAKLKMRSSDMYTSIWPWTKLRSKHNLLPIHHSVFSSYHIPPGMVLLTCTLPLPCFPNLQSGNRLLIMSLEDWKLILDFWLLQLCCADHNQLVKLTTLMQGIRN